MNNLKSCEWDCISEDKNGALEDLEWNDCKSLDRKHVNVLLDISVEHTLKEQDPYMAQSQGWEEAIKGWGRSAPLACLFQAQRKGRKVKPDVIDSHCLLCGDLKLSELLVSDCANSPSESCVIAEEPLKNTIPASLELLKRAPSNSSSSPSEEESSDFSKGPVTVVEKVVTDGDGEKAVVIPYCSSTVDICQGSLTSKHEPGQHQYHLLSIAVSKKAYLLPQATSLLGRNLRQDELTRSPLRHNSGHRPHLGLKAKSIKKAEPELPMLLGTRVAVPVSGQRLL
ncbi:hypothetical protein AOLI_G00094460 [Acnodon oligacanthus]